MITKLKKYSIYNLIIGFSSLLFYISCNKRNGYEFDKKLVEKIALEKTDLPSKFSSIPFFGKCSDNKVAEIYIQDLRALYRDKWQNLKYQEFLEQALNQKINIEYQGKIECFDLDKNVAEAYENDGFDNFLNSYTENKSSGRLVLKSMIKENQINTVLYYLFLNNYLALYDDNIGKYYINKASTFSK